MPLPLSLPSVPLTATVPGLFRRRSINFIVGGPASGRLRLALTHLDSYASPTSPVFLDHPIPYPEQLGCVVCDQSRDHILLTLQEMDLSNLCKPSVFPVMKWEASEEAADELFNKFPLDATYDYFTKPHPNNPNVPPPTTTPPKFLLIEGLQQLLPGPGSKRSDPKAVGIFMNRLQEFCNGRDCTILGIVPTSKAKKGDFFKSTGHVIYGSGQWAESADSVISIEHVAASTHNGLTDIEAEFYRRIIIQARGKALQKLWARFDTYTGRMYITSEPSAPVVSGSDILDYKLATQPDGIQLKRPDIQAWGIQAGIGERTVDRWIVSCISNQRLVKTGTTRGVFYTKPPAPPEN